MPTVGGIPDPVATMNSAPSESVQKEAMGGDTTVFAPPPSPNPTPDISGGLKVSVPAETSNSGGTTLVPGIKLAIPSLRGVLSIAPNGHHVCKGVWALSDELHNVAGQTSDFEFKLTRPASTQEDNRTFPLSGKYTGWFKLKNKSGKSKFDDSLELRFSNPTEYDSNMIHGTLNVRGEGKNQFGGFTVNGTLTPGVEPILHMYRTYLPKTPRAKTPKAPRPPVPSTVGIAAGSDGTGRIRKANSGFADFVEPSLIVSKKQSKPKDTRPQRLNPALLKCSQILADLMKLPAAAFFAVPVDYVKLGILDYPTIISKPMDLGTVRTNLTNFIYQAPLAFAEDMRLVFRNAIEYNTSRDHPVHKAARDMAAKFEHKYASLRNSLTTGTLTGDPAPHNVPPTKQKSAPPRRKSTGPSRQRSTHAVPAPVAGGDHDLVRNMAKQMQLMQEELARLKQAEAKREVSATLEQHRFAAEHPLTVEEKKQLVQKVHKLPPARSAQLLELIRECMGVDMAEDGEISIDDLDTYTLRSMQDFCATGTKQRKEPTDNFLKKRKSTGGRGGTQARPATTTMGGIAKKPKTAPLAPPPSTSMNATPAALPKSLAIPHTEAVTEVSFDTTGRTPSVAEVAQRAASNFQSSAPDLGSPLPPYEGGHARPRSGSLEGDDLMTSVDSMFGADVDEEVAPNGEAMSGWLNAPGPKGGNTPALGTGSSLWSAAMQSKQDEMASADAERKAVKDAAAHKARVDAQRLADMQSVASNQVAEQEAAAAAEAAQRLKVATDLAAQREAERQQRDIMTQGDM